MFIQCRYVRRRRALFRRLIGGVLLLVYAVTAAGIPLPSAVILSDSHKSQELHPCAGGACGCGSADHCWRSCCCHTLAERLAWARKHGVRPPDFAVMEARLAGFDLAWLEGDGGTNPDSSDRQCCVAHKNTSPKKCCRHAVAVKAERAVRACCSNRGKPSSATTSGFGTEQQQVVVWQAMKCKGQSLKWLVAAPLLTEVPFDFNHTLPLVARLGRPASDAPLAPVDNPAVPPPERV